MKRTYKVGDSGDFGPGTIGSLFYPGQIIEVLENTIVVKTDAGDVKVFEKEEAPRPPEFHPGDLVKGGYCGKEIVGVLGNFLSGDEWWYVETANGRYSFSRHILQKATWDDLRRFLDAQAVLTEVPV